jgi:uncharacterized RDD family membrane protein YckC
MNKDFDIDDILNQDDLFKPITDGLGFHHSVKDKKDIAISLKQKSSDLKRDLNIRTRQLAKESKITSETIDMGELAPFYKKETNKTIQTIELNFEREDVSKEEVETVNIFKRLSAYTIDLSLLFTSLSVAFVASLYSTGMSFNTAKSLLRDPLSFILFSVITSLFYVLYFTFFDKGSFSSIGKRMLNIKLVSLEGELTFSQTFHRSCLSLLSLFSVGLFNLLKLEDKLTNTTVVTQD